MKLTCKYILIGVLGALMTSCYEDKGNYVYSEIENIDIKLPSTVVVMANVDDIVITPEVTSSLAGEITDENANYEFACRVKYDWRDDDGNYLDYYDINPEGKKDINSGVRFPTGAYTVWYSVKNKETEVTTNAKCVLNVVSTTSEGWMVLSNVGAEKKGRLDMVFKDPKGEMQIARNVLGMESPTITNATKIYMYASHTYNAEHVYLLSYSGAYDLDQDELTTTEKGNFRYTDCILSEALDGEPVAMEMITCKSTYGPSSNMIVTSNGNAYAKLTQTYGVCYEDLMNTDKRGNPATYKVAPFVGVSCARISGYGGNSYGALLYDETNKRFVGWDFTGNTEKAILYPLSDPEGSSKLFSFTTGMDIVTMKSTRFADGMVFSVLQDANRERHVYGINLGGTQFTQAALYSGITAENFNNAVDYAFHSQFPFMFYAYDDKVYSYNLGSGMLNDVLTLPAGEKVTMLKFNLYNNSGFQHLVDSSEEFLAKQFNLIVASTNGADDGGVVRFYKIDNSGKMTRLEEYKGFGNVVDVTYRERRKDDQ